MLESKLGVNLNGPEDVPLCVGPEYKNLQGQTWERGQDPVPQHGENLKSQQSVVTSRLNVIETTWR